MAKMGIPNGLIKWIQIVQLSFKCDYSQEFYYWTFQSHKRNKTRLPIVSIIIILHLRRRARQSDQKIKLQNSPSSFSNFEDVQFNNKTNQNGLISFLYPPLESVGKFDSHTPLNPDNDCAIAQCSLWFYN